MAYGEGLMNKGLMFIGYKSNKFSERLNRAHRKSRIMLISSNEE